MNKAGKITDDVFNNLYTKSIEFSGKTKNLIEYLKKFERDKKREIK